MGDDIATKRACEKDTQTLYVKPFAHLYAF